MGGTRNRWALGLALTGSLLAAGCDDGNAGIDVPDKVDAGSILLPDQDAVDQGVADTGLEVDAAIDDVDSGVDAGGDQVDGGVDDDMGEQANGSVNVKPCDPLPVINEGITAVFLLDRSQAAYTASDSLFEVDREFPPGVDSQILPSCFEVCFEGDGILDYNPNLQTFGSHNSLSTSIVSVDGDVLLFNNNQGGPGTLNWVANSSVPLGNGECAKVEHHFTVTQPELQDVDDQKHWRVDLKLDNLGASIVTDDYIVSGNTFFAADPNENIHLYPLYLNASPASLQPFESGEQNPRNGLTIHKFDLVAEYGVNDSITQINFESSLGDEWEGVTGFAELTYRINGEQVISPAIFNVQGNSINIDLGDTPMPIYSGMIITVKLAASYINSTGESGEFRYRVTNIASTNGTDICHYDNRGNCSGDNLNLNEEWNRCVESGDGERVNLGMIACDTFRQEWGRHFNKGNRYNNILGETTELDEAPILQVLCSGINLAGNDVIEIGSLNRIALYMQVDGLEYEQQFNLVIRSLNSGDVILKQLVAFDVPEAEEGQDGSNKRRIILNLNEADREYLINSDESFTIALTLPDGSLEIPNHQGDNIFGSLERIMPKLKVVGVEVLSENDEAVEVTLEAMQVRPEGFGLENVTVDVSGIPGEEEALGHSEIYAKLSDPLTTCEDAAFDEVIMVDLSDPNPQVFTRFALRNYYGETRIDELTLRVLTDKRDDSGITAHLEVDHGARTYRLAMTNYRPLDPDEAGNSEVEIRFQQDIASRRPPVDRGSLNKDQEGQTYRDTIVSLVISGPGIGQFRPPIAFDLVGARLTYSHVFDETDPELENPLYAGPARRGPGRVQVRDDISSENRCLGPVTDAE